ncbi:hypothetical protein [Sphingomonas sp. Leaf257]|uniref:hypothetical protein n=1 Tax=Sphingomonas sp. Leaf257 TaxID=1736309 RepID=UPI0012E2A729|nr:hypothetical protein [Sphingomonas sp. Leaf257]
MPAASIAARSSTSVMVASVGRLLSKVHPAVEVGAALLMASRLVAGGSSATPAPAATIGCPAGDSFSVPSRARAMPPGPDIRTSGMAPALGYALSPAA